MLIKGFGVFRTSWILVTVLSICASLHSQHAGAQDTQFSFGSPFSPGGSGGGRTRDINRQGFGTQFRAGHDAGKTVGRADSITHVELMPFVNMGNGLVFGDSRLVYSNRERLAWSFGAGYRHYIPECGVVIGGYGFFDRDELLGTPMKQWSVGADIFGDGWEGRANYYQPFGKSSGLVGDRADATSSTFSGNQLLYDRILTFAQGFEGGDAEIGFQLPGRISRQLDLKAFGGAYYYDGESVGDTTGWSTRLQAEIRRQVALGVALTDDELFHTNVMFNVAFRFGGYTSQEHTKSSPMQHLGDPVRRNMNIVGSVSDVVLPGEIAIDPRTGLPYRFVHVDSNTAGAMLGTFEDPYATIAAGRADTGADDVLYVHAGSSFADAANNNIPLGAGERIFGEGRVQTSEGPRTIVNSILVQDLGPIVLPQSNAFIASGGTLGRPELIGAPADGLVLNDDVILTGLIFDMATARGIYGNGVENADIRDVAVIASGGDGILLENTLGVTAFTNSTIEATTGSAFHVNGGAGAISFSSTSAMADPAYGAISNTSAEVLLIENMAGGSVNLTSATIDDDGGAGIVIRDNSSTVTIDNASLLNSTGDGVSIINSGGRITFRNTIRNATLIDGATGHGFFVDGLLANSTVNAQSLQIDNRRGSGVRLENTSGNFVVSDGVDITTPFAPATVDPAIFITNSQTGSLIEFGKRTAPLDAVSIDGSGGAGIEITQSQAGSTIEFGQSVDIGNTTGPGLNVFNDSADISFNGLTIPSGLDRGIRISNVAGTMQFDSVTDVDNLDAVAVPRVEIADSTGSVGFDSLNINNALDFPGGGAGLHLMNNIAVPGVGSANILINALSINSLSGTAMYGRDNTNVTVRDGSIMAFNGPAIDLENTGINLTFESVSSSDSPTFGVRLVDTEVFGLANPTVGTFTVLGLPLATLSTDGGIIQNPVDEGILLSNAGRVALNEMTIIDADVGILVDDSNITDDTDRTLRLNFVTIAQSDTHGLEAHNALEIIILDSLFDANGDDANTGRFSILSDYSEVPNDPDTTQFLEYTLNPYIFEMQRTQILDTSHDAILIANVNSPDHAPLVSLTGRGAHLDLFLQNNNITNADLLDPAGADTNDDSLIVRWDGPIRSQLLGNAFDLTGTNVGEPQDAIDLQTFSFTDQFINVVQGNRINASSDGSFGIRVNSRAQTTGLIDANTMLFAGGTSTGMSFTFGDNAAYVIQNNNYTDNLDGGTGIIFNAIRAPSTITMNGNVITLFDPFGGANPERGIIFQGVGGVIDLNGSQINTNIVQLGNFGPGAFIETIFAMPAGTNNGQIFVNGIAVP